MIINPVAGSKRINIESDIPKDAIIFAYETILITIIRNLLSNTINSFSLVLPYAISSQKFRKVKYGKKPNK